MGFPSRLTGKESAANERDTRGMGSILGSGRSSRGGHGSSPQYSRLGTPWTEEPGRPHSMGVTKSWTRPSICMHVHRGHSAEAEEKRKRCTYDLIYAFPCERLLQPSKRKSPLRVCVGSGASITSHCKEYAFVIQGLFLWCHKERSFAWKLRAELSIPLTNYLTALSKLLSISPPQCPQG